MTKDEKNITEYSKLFSSKLLEQRKFNKVRTAVRSVEKLLCTGNGHGPFAEFNDGSVKFDFSNTYNQTLLGYTHPLKVKSDVEATLNVTSIALNSDKLKKLESMPDFKSLFYNYRDPKLTEDMLNLLIDGFFGPDERIESLTRFITAELEKLKKNNLIIKFVCTSLFFTLTPIKEPNIVKNKLLDLGVVTNVGEKNELCFFPPITLTSIHIKNAFAIIEKSLE